MADHGVVSAMESFFSSLKTERIARKICRSRDEAKADVFDYIERFCNPKRRQSTIGLVDICPSQSSLPLELVQATGRFCAKRFSYGNAVKVLDKLRSQRELPR